MYTKIIVVALAAFVAAAEAHYLAGPLPLAAPILAPAPITTTAHVGNVVTGVSRAFTNVPHTRFARTDWNQPGSLITSPIHAPIIQPVFQNIAVPGPTHYTQHLVPNPPLAINERHLVHGVAHVPTVAHVPAAVPVAAPVAVAAPVHAAPVAVKGY